MIGVPFGGKPTYARPDEIPSIGNQPTLRSRPWQAGDKLMNRYRVVSELGRGGMGVVYKCLDEVGGIEVALKSLPPELSHNCGEMEEVRENFQLVSKLIHQHIAAVKTLEQDPSGGNYYLILELAEGVDLRKWRKQQGGKVTLEKAVPILRQVAQALDYAHSLRIIHRDAKPGNVIISADRTVKVLDFGLAAQIQTSLARVSQVHFNTSGTGPYMSPEQWRGQRQDGASDQYALAVMAFELLAGHLPFDSQDQYALRESVIHELPHRPAGTSDTVWLALSHGLSKTSAERYHNCTEFVAALEGDLAAEPKSKAPSSKTKKGLPPKTIASRSKIPLLALVILLLLLISAAGWYFGEKHSPQKTPPPESIAIQKAAEEKIRAVAGARVRADAEKQRLENEKLVAEEKGRVEAETKAKAEAETKAKSEAYIRAEATYQEQERERLANVHGALMVDTDPSGAKVDLGSEGVQESPARFNQVHIGRLLVTISRPGYDPVQQEVEIKENGIADLGRIKLVHQTGSVHISSSPAGAMVMQEGKEVGITPLTLSSVPPGEVTYSLKLPRHRDVTLSGTVHSLQELALRAILATAYPQLDNRYTNSLGMAFAAVPGTRVLFGIWDVRVQDYRAFSAANSGVKNDWQKPGFAQGDAHPVVKVSWNDAENFCAWLTGKEQREGLIALNQSYRLPTDSEWSTAVGLNESPAGTPAEKDGRIRDEYPWGKNWPAPYGVGNYGQGLHVDNFPHTSPVGSFPANRYGLYDMGGNVWQWCEDYYDSQASSRPLRGGSWTDNGQDRALSSYRHNTGSGGHDNHCGFRCVLVVGAVN